MRRDLKKEAVKTKIINAIWQMIEKVNFEAISVNDIAGKAQVSKRTIYEYFSSKEEMYLELICQAFFELEQAMVNEAQTADMGNSVEVIEKFGRSYVDFMINHQTKATLIMSYNPDKYRDTFPEKVERIDKINEVFLTNYKLGDSFVNSEIGKQISVSEMYLFLWTYTTGIAALMVNKGEWMEKFFADSDRNILDVHFTLLKNMLTK